jgi:hypothetical protein
VHVDIGSIDDEEDDDDDDDDISAPKLPAEEERR